MYDAHSSSLVATPADALAPLPNHRTFSAPLVPTSTYAPTSLTISLTPRQARVMSDLAEGFRQARKSIRHPSDAIKHLLDILAGE